MTTCYYYITDTKGGDPIRIPAYKVLEKVDLKKYIPNIDSITSLDKSVRIGEKHLPEFKKFIKAFAPNEIINSVITEDSDLVYPLQLIETINNYNEENRGSLHLWQQIKALIASNDKSVKGLTKKSIIKKLSNPESKFTSMLFNTYGLKFNGNSEAQFLSATSINDELIDLNNLIEEAESNGNNTLYLNALKRFIENFNNVYQWNNSENLIKIPTDNLYAGNWNYDNAIVFSDHPLKTHMTHSLINKLLSDIDINNLKNIVNNWNQFITDNKLKDEYKLPIPNDTKDFFYGKTTDKELVRPVFDNLVQMANIPNRILKGGLMSTLDELFSLAADNLGEENKESNMNLIKSLFSNVFTQNRFTEMIEEEKRMNELLKVQNTQILRNQLNDVRLLDSTKDLSKRYRIAESVKSSNEGDDSLYYRIMDNVTINKDLVRLPGLTQKSDDPTKWPNWVITSVFPRSNGVYITGHRINQYGTHETTKYLMPLDGELWYRKYDDYYEDEDNTQDRELAISKQNSFIVEIPKGMTREFAQNMLSVYDKIGNAYITGIYPGYYTTRENGKPERKHAYKKEFDTDGPTFKLWSKKLAKNSEQLGNYISSKHAQGMIIDKHHANIKNLSAGDYFKLDKWKHYKSIIHADSNYVWADKEETDKATGESYYVIYKYKRSDIHSGMVNMFDSDHVKADIMKIVNQKNLSDEMTFSTIKNKESIKNGDYYVINVAPDQSFIGVVTDKVNKLGKYYDTKNNVWSTGTYDVKGVVFKSSDFKNTAHTMLNFSANLLNVGMKESLTNDDVEMRYVISPSSFVNPDINNFIAGSMYLNVGKYVESKYVGDNIDITDEIIKAKGGIVGVSKLFVSKKGSAQYERNFDSAGLVEIKGFDKLSKEDFKNSIKPGSYISTYGNKSIDSSLYRIEKIEPNGTVYARMYKRNKDGGLFFIEQEFDLNTLLDINKDSNGLHKPGSISNLYLIKGNNKIGELFQKIGDANKKETDSKKKEPTKRDIMELNDKIQGFFSEFGIDVVFKPKTEFANNVKAKLQYNNETGKTSILLKRNLGERGDLVHEAMHLFLGALRLSNLTAYGTLINSIDVDESRKGNMLDHEEAFLEKLSDNLNMLEDSFFSQDMNMADFMSGMNAVSDLFNDVKLSKPNETMLQVLNKPLAEFMGSIGKTFDRELFNMNAAQMTPAFMRWAESKEIKIECK